MSNALKKKCFCQKRVLIFLKSSYFPYKGRIIQKKNENGFGQKVFLTTKSVFLAYYTKKKIIFLTKTIFFSFAFDQKIIFHVNWKKNGFVQKNDFKPQNDFLQHIIQKLKSLFWDKTTFFSILNKKQSHFWTKKNHFSFKTVFFPFFCDLRCQKKLKSVFNFCIRWLNKNFGVKKHFFWQKSFYFFSV